MFETQIANKYFDRKSKIEYIDIKTTGIYESKLYDILYNNDLTLF